MLTVLEIFLIDDILKTFGFIYVTGTPVTLLHHSVARALWALVTLAHDAV